MARTFLSIDLDYWKLGQRSRCEAFFKKVYALKLPIHTACEHHFLLDSMNGDFDTLINVDWHSDLCDTPQAGWEQCDLNDGTWGNFVKWRKHGTFIWRYPRPGCLSRGGGYCHALTNPFEEPVSGWQTVRKQQGLAGIPWANVKAVGVCLSPTWIGRESVIQGPIKQLKMLDWLELGQAGWFLPKKQVRIVRI